MCENAVGNGSVSKEAEELKRRRRRVLLTGSNGFIGLTFQEAMRRRFKIIGADVAPPKERFPEVTYAYCDVTDKGDMNRVVTEFDPEYIVHLAARSRVFDGIADPFGTIDVNVNGTMNVLEAARRGPSLEAIITTSSETVYGTLPPERFPSKEEWGPGRPTSVYAASKAAADLLAQQFSIPGARVVVARSAMGCGCRSSPIGPSAQVTAKFIRNALRGDPLRFPGVEVDPQKGVAFHPRNGTQPRGSHPTRDVNPGWNFVLGLGLILENEDASGVYNLGSGREISVLDLARIVVQTIGVGDIQWDPGFDYRRGEENDRTWLDVTRARSDLGYDPCVSLEDAIRGTANWMLKHPDYYEAKHVPAHEAWRGIPGTETRR